MTSIAFREIIAGLVFLALSKCSLVASSSISKGDSSENGIGLNSKGTIPWYEDDTDDPISLHGNEEEIMNDGIFDRISNIIPGREYLPWNAKMKNPIVPVVNVTANRANSNDGILDRFSKIIPGSHYFPWNMNTMNAIATEMSKAVTELPNEGLFDRFTKAIPGMGFLPWNMETKNSIVTEVTEAVTEVANNGLFDRFSKIIPGREFLPWNGKAKNSSVSDGREIEVSNDGLFDGLSKIIPGRDFLTWNVKTKSSNHDKSQRRQKIKYLLTDKHIDQYHPLKRDGSDAHFRMVGGCTLKVLIHGFTHRDESWEDKITRSKMFMLADEFIESGRRDLEVIVVDWTELSSYPPYRYREAADSTQYAGVDVAEFLVALEARKLIKFDNVHIIGYSLGAHVSGVAGYTIQEMTGRKVARITGIEPAGPLFVEGNDIISDKRMALEKTDAEFVDIIHCNMGEMLDAKWGSKVQAGHADFYPNGGKSQRGCDSFRDATQGCSHSICPSYYVQSINLRRFPSCRCPSWKTYNRAKYKCDCQEYAVEMGEHLNTSLATGRYYLHI